MTIYVIGMFLFIIACESTSVEEDNNDDFDDNNDNWWNYSVTVKVYNTQTSSPIEGARISLSCYSGVSTQYTNGSGEIIYTGEAKRDFVTAVCSIYVPGFKQPEYYITECCLWCGTYVAGTERRIMSWSSSATITIYLSPE